MKFTGVAQGLRSEQKVMELVCEVPEDGVISFLVYNLES